MHELEDEPNLFVNENVWRVPPQFIRHRLHHMVLAIVVHNVQELFLLNFSGFFLDIGRQLTADRNVVHHARFMKLYIVSCELGHDI